MNLLRRDILFEERLFAASLLRAVGGKCKSVIRPTSWRFHLFGPRRIFEARAKARLDVRDRYLFVERGERSNERGRGVALHDHPIGLVLANHVRHAEEHARGEVGEALVRLHQVEVELRLHVEDREHLIEHRTMLRGDAHRRFERRIGFQGLRQERHFYGFWPRAKHGENALLSVGHRRLDGTVPHARRLSHDRVPLAGYERRPGSDAVSAADRRILVRGRVGHVALGARDGGAGRACRSARARLRQRAHREGKAHGRSADLPSDPSLRSQELRSARRRAPTPGRALPRRQVGLARPPERAPRRAHTSPP